jgi:hypothetical protein
MSSKYSDAVSRMLMRVALQEGHEGASTASSNALKPHLGPLTIQELSELTFLCNTAASGNNPYDGFATVEGDQLVALIELLDRHVNLAVAVNLVEQALQHIEPGAAPSVIASEMDKVSAGSCWNFIVAFVHAQHWNIRERSCKGRKLLTHIHHV